MCVLVCMYVRICCSENIECTLFWLCAEGCVGKYVFVCVCVCVACKLRSLTCLTNMRCVDAYLQMNKPIYTLSVYVCHRILYVCDQTFALANVWTHG